MANIKVILLEPIRRFGTVGDIVEVKGGFFRNWLRPQKKAQLATKENIAALESRKKDLLLENQKKKEYALALQAKLEGKVCYFEKEAEENGHLYGSVAPGDVIDYLANEGIEVTKQQILLSAPFKNTGTYTIKCDLHSEVVAEIQVVIERKATQH